MGAYLFVNGSNGEGDLSGLHGNLNVASQTEGLTAAGLRGIIRFWTIRGLWAFIVRARPIRILFQRAIETIGPVYSPRSKGLPTDNPSVFEKWLRLGRSQNIRPGAILHEQNELFALKYSFGMTYEEQISRKSKSCGRRPSTDGKQENHRDARLLSLA